MPSVTVSAAVDQGTVLAALDPSLLVVLRLLGFGGGIGCVGFQ